MVRNVVLFLLVLSLTATLGFSQDKGTSDPSNGQNSNSSSTANSGAAASNNNVTNNYGAGQLIQALPGPTGNPGPFPGYPIQNESWDRDRNPYFNPYLREATNEMIEAGHSTKHVKVNNSLVILKSDTAKDNPIHMLNWPSNLIYVYRDDKLAGVVDVQGQQFESVEAVILSGYYEVKKRQIDTNRCLVYPRVLNMGITKGLSIGTGGAGGMILGPGKNADAASFAGGGILGTNKTFQANAWEVEFKCLNTADRFDPPQAPKKDSDEPKPEAPPEKAQPAPNPAPAPPQPAPQPQAAAPVPAPVETPAPTPPPFNCAAATDLPQSTFYFPYDHPRPGEKYKVTTEDRVRLQVYAQWLINHQTCMIQFEGHASEEGTPEYNEALGRRRAKPLYDALVSYCDAETRKRVKQYVSGGKDFPADESHTEKARTDNRRVIIRIIGPASGK